MKEKMETGTDLFRTEKIPKILLKIAPPVMLAQLIQAMYNIVDSFFVRSVFRKFADSAVGDLSAVAYHYCRRWEPVSVSTRTWRDSMRRNSSRKPRRQREPAWFWNS